MSTRPIPPIEKAIIKTLVYRDLFDYPLTAEEVYRFLIQQDSSRGTVEKFLRKMIAEGKIQRRGSYHFLPGREKIARLRQKREAISQRKFKEALHYANLLRFIPWVKAVFATGALAAGNADEESDLDLLIIATPRRLWLTRFLVFLVFSLLGVMRKPQSVQVKDKICPNMFSSELTLAIPPNEQNLYTAHEVVQAKIIWEEAPLCQRFLAANDWIKKFLPNFYLPPKLDKSRFKRGFFFLDWLELLAYRLQLKYMSRRRTREIVTPERILFHPIDQAAKILPMFEKRLVPFSLRSNKQE